MYINIYVYVCIHDCRDGYRDYKSWHVKILNDKKWLYIIFMYMCYLEICQCNLLDTFEVIVYYVCMIWWRE